MNTPETIWRRIAGSTLVVAGSAIVACAALIGLPYAVLGLTGFIGTGFSLENPALGFFVIGLLFCMGIPIGIPMVKRGLRLFRRPPEPVSYAAVAVAVQGLQQPAGPPVCPACGATLVETAQGDLNLDVCRDGCGGIWFDNFELRQAATSPDGLEAACSPEAPAARSIHADPNTKRPCPKCHGVRMLNRFFSDTCHIEIDECPGCGGIWVDHGEFERIQASLAHRDANAPVSSSNPETAILMARAQTEMTQASQHTHARVELCKFIGRRYHTGQL